MAKTALCIGINNYTGTHMDLQGCINDAEDRAAELTSRGFTVTKRIDTKANKAAMAKGFKAIVTGAKKGDTRIKGRANGAFTYYALKALKTLKVGATYADWQAAINPAYLPSASYPQSPQIVGSADARKRKIFS